MDCSFRICQDIFDGTMSTLPLSTVSVFCTPSSAQTITLRTVFVLQYCSSSNPITVNLESTVLRTMYCTAVLQVLVSYTGEFY
jgi:hypothetical protein